MQVKDVHGLREEKVMRLLVDRVKCHEIYFDPKIIGISQCSLIETIMLSIAGFDQMVCSALLSNVIVIGGASVVPGLKQRL